MANSSRPAASLAAMITSGMDSADIASDSASSMNLFLPKEHSDNNPSGIVDFREDSISGSSAYPNAITPIVTNVCPDKSLVASPMVSSAAGPAVYGADVRSAAIHAIATTVVPGSNLAAGSIANPVTCRNSGPSVSSVTNLAGQAPVDSAAHFVACFQNPVDSMNRTDAPSVTDSGGSSFVEIIRTNLPDLLKLIDTKSGLQGELKKLGVFPPRPLKAFWVRLVSI